MTTTIETRGQANEGNRQRRPRIDVWTWFAVVVGGLFWAATASPLGDPDIWWHVRTGELILSSGVPHSEPWAFTAQGRPWVPTAWLSDVMLAGLHDAFGWHGIVLYKVVFSGAVLLALGRSIFRAATRAWRHPCLPCAPSRYPRSWRSDLS